ncbi:cation transporter [Azospirillum sp. ST 5-10]|uniref:cation transporter n=1 Tax=unclassified Azospirillum TaxID=2630922 RepID=UPI003F4A49A7
MAGCRDGGCGLGGGRGGGDHRRTLRAALVVNGAMVAVMLAAGSATGSVALRADALTFLTAATGHGFGLWALGAAPGWRSGAAVARGAVLVAAALWVLATAAANAAAGTVPDAPVMGLAGLLALGANLTAAAMLFAGRRGGATLRAVWLCARRAAAADLAVMLAAAGVASTATGWPDVVVAVGVAALALGSAGSLLRHGVAELRALHGGRTA